MFKKVLILCLLLILLTGCGKRKLELVKLETIDSIAIVSMRFNRELVSKYKSKFSTALEYEERQFYTDFSRKVENVVKNNIDLKFKDIKKFEKSKYYKRLTKRSGLHRTVYYPKPYRSLNYKDTKRLSQIASDLNVDAVAVIDFYYIPFASKMPFKKKYKFKLVSKIIVVNQYAETVAKYHISSPKLRASRSLEIEKTGFTAETMNFYTDLMEAFYARLEDVITLK
ncbi:hypothetical protein DID75_02290 [Candidatus Marinamargulisbacteria bacterium SCGC AG-410-N11]|nr:hypothetical protein DID75_02290 [Candidatus Marinamargulisbacteria bacterium SCGC AG-410-N11]